MKGKVKWFDGWKGYGFITYDDGKEVFVFYTSILSRDRHLEEGEEVSFDIKDMRNGPMAINVVKLKIEKKE